MTRISRIARAAAAAALLSLGGVAAASAQAPSSPYTTRTTTRGASQPQIDRALREFGFNPSTLRRDQQRAIDDAWRQLLPDANPYRYTLNQAQATAIVYLALVHGRGERGGWNGDGRDDDPRGGWNGGGDNGYGRGSDGYGRDDSGYNRGGDAQCVALNRRVYDIENAVAADTRSLFLGDAQRRDVRAAAGDVQRMAVDRGWRRVADRASEIISAVGDNMPERSDVSGRVQALKRAVDESCGQDGWRR
jgi:hypothetical protein